MSKNLRDLVVLAAELRAVGYAWDTVAERVHRQARTCQKWPTRHKDLLDATYRVAQQKRFQEINTEASAHMNALMRSTDEKVRLKANEVWMKCGAAFVAKLETAPAVDPERERAHEIYRLIQESRERLRREANAERLAAGRPPITETELNYLWDREWGPQPPDDPADLDEGCAASPPTSPAAAVLAPLVAAVVIAVALVALVRPRGTGDEAVNARAAVAFDREGRAARLQWIGDGKAERAGLYFGVCRMIRKAGAISSKPLALLGFGRPPEWSPVVTDSHL